MSCTWDRSTQSRTAILWNLAIRCVRIDTTSATNVSETGIEKQSSQYIVIGPSPLDNSTFCSHVSSLAESSPEAACMIVRDTDPGATYLPSWDRYMHMEPSSMISNNSITLCPGGGGGERNDARGDQLLVVACEVDHNHTWTRTLTIERGEHSLFSWPISYGSVFIIWMVGGMSSQKGWHIPFSVNSDEYGIIFCWVSKRKKTELERLVGWS